MNPTPPTDKTASAAPGGTASRAGTERSGTGKGDARRAARHAAGWVAFVGAGPGDPGLLTMRGAELVGQADLVVATPPIGDRLAHLLRDDAALADSADYADPKSLVKAARSGQLVVRMFSGDPFADPLVAVRLGTLDGDPGIRPHFRQFVSSAASWEPLPDDGLERHPRSRDAQTQT